jgi:hypothetical protein
VRFYRAYGLDERAEWSNASVRIFATTFDGPA